MPEPTNVDVIATQLPDLHMANVAHVLCQKLNVAGCIVLTSLEDGNMGLTAYGVTHARANELLSLGIHINLSQHDAHVRMGRAGEQAQENQAKVDEASAALAKEGE